MQFQDIDIKLTTAQQKLLEALEYEFSDVIDYPVKFQVKGKVFKAALLPQLQNLICQQFNVLWEDIISINRYREVAEARHLYCFIAKKYFGLHHDEIATHLKRNRSTASNSILVVKHFLSIKDEAMTNSLKAIIDKLKEHDTI